MFPAIIGPFRKFGVNHVLGMTGLKSLVRRSRVCLRAMPPISMNLQKIAHFRIGNCRNQIGRLGMAETAVIVWFRHGTVYDISADS